MPLRTFTRALALLLVTGLGLSACALFTPAQDRERAKQISGRSGETQAERYYRRAINCMDEFQREDCARENLEQVVNLNPDDREILGDAIFRLIDIYKRSGEQEALTELMRRYWKLGTKKRDASIRSYGVQFFPTDLSILAVLDVKRLRDSRMMNILGDELLEYRLTCDEDRRRAIEFDTWMQTAGTAPEIQAMDQEARQAAFEAAKEEKRRARSRGRDDAADADRDGPPSMGDDLCDVLARLGVTTLEDFERVTFASRHDDPLRSLVSLERGDVQALVDDGLARGVLTPAGPLSYAVTDAGEDELQVVLVQVDSDELVMARRALAGEVAAARDALKRVRRSELLDLVTEVPSDSVFYAVITREVLSWARSRAGPLKMLVPEPQGLVVASAVYEHAGLFVRLRTGDRLRASTLVWLAEKILGAEEEEEDVDGSGPGDMDIAVLPGEGILFGITMSPPQARPMFLPDL